MEQIELVDGLNCNLFLPPTKPGYKKYLVTITSFVEAEAIVIEGSRIFRFQIYARIF